MTRSRQDRHRLLLEEVWGVMRESGVSWVSLHLSLGPLAYRLTASQKVTSLEASVTLHQLDSSAFLPSSVAFGLVPFPFTV